MLPPDYKYTRSGGIVEPLSLPDARNFLRISNFTDDDALILSCISAARRKCEQITNTSLVASSYLLTADYLPWGSTDAYWQSWLAQCGNFYAASVIELPNPPLVAVQSITYVGADGLPHILDPTAYRVSPGTPGQIQPAIGTIWPFIQPEISAVQIAYTVGGVNSDDIACVQAAMRLIVNFLYDRRSADAPIPSQVTDVLGPARNYGYA